MLVSGFAAVMGFYISTELSFLYVSKTLPFQARRIYKISHLFSKPPLLFLFLNRKILFG